MEEETTIMVFIHVRMIGTTPADGGQAGVTETTVVGLLITVLIGAGIMAMACGPTMPGEDGPMRIDRLITQYII